MSTTTTEAKRLPKTTQGDLLVPALIVEIFFHGDLLGAIEAPQEDLLSKSGNVLYRGAINRGWRLGDGNVSETLAALSYRVNGVDATMSAKGVNLTAPRTSKKTGLVIAGSGGEHIVSHTAFINASSVEGETVDYMVNVHALKIKDLKAGQDQGFKLRVQGLPKGVGRAAGPQVVGTVDGLTIS